MKISIKNNIKIYNEIVAIFNYLIYFTYSLLIVLYDNIFFMSSSVNS